MADNVIDSLSLEISSDSKAAEQSIERLAKTLLKLQTSVKGLDNINLNGFKNAMSGLQDMMSGFQGTENLEKGINQVQRLSRIEPENMYATAAGIKDIGEALRGMAGITIPNLDGIDNLIANIRKFGGVSFGNAKDYLPQISQSLVGFVKDLNRVGSVQFDFSGVATLVQNISRLGGAKASEAVKNLPSLSRDLVNFINSLNGIQTLNFDLTGLTGLVSSITKLGGKAATNAVPNITNLATALRQMMATLSTAPKVSQNVIQMTQALAQLASTGGQAGTASRGLVSSFNSLPAATKKAKSGFSGLAGAIGKFYATWWLLIRGANQFKKAIDISSDLTEVQNVVDVTFGAMSDKMNEFSESALQNYGMSELMAKQIASRFQAMGVAMGFTQEKMSDMSIELTKLAGDMASFYNVEQEAVAKSLQSVFTGETEPLRKYGLDLTNATIQAWALAQGMDANVNKMTQAEKTMLRYQYVLANTGAASGDFLRTVNSWHNQLVLLSGAFQQLGSIVGGVLVNAFKPFIQALNSVMGSVIQFAQTVSDALGAIFGWKYEVGGGVAQDLELGATAAEDIEDATGGAAKKAKELNKYIAAWHEVNNMTSNDNTGSGGSSGGTGSGSGSGPQSAGEWIQAESLWEKYTSEIDTLYKLGEYIGKTLTDAMNSIDWESVYAGARNFGTGLADFLNGLISPELFGATGRTIAGALNTAIYAALSFGERFDWIDFGESIASGINNFFTTFDFSALADTWNAWANGLVDSLTTVLEKVKWEKIGNQIGAYLEGLDLTKVFMKAAKAIWKGLNAALKTYKGMLETAPFETALVTVLTSTKVLSKVKIGAKDLAGNISKILSLALKNAMQYIKIGFSGGGIFDGLIDGSKAAVKTVQSELSKLNAGAKITIGAATVLGEFTLIQDGIASLLSGPESFGEIAVSIGEIGVAALAAKPILVGVFGPAGAVIAAITGVAGAFLGINNAMEEMAQNSAIGQFSQAIGDLSSEVSQKSEEIKQSLENTKTNIESAGAAEAQMARVLASEYEKLSEKTSLSADDKERLKQISQELVGIIPSLQGYIDDETGALDIQKETLAAVIQGYESLAQKQAAQEYLVEAYRDQYEAQMNVKKAQDEYNAAFEEYLADAGLAPDVIRQIRDNQFDLNKAELEWQESPYNFAEHYGVKDFGTLKKAVNGLSKEMDSYNTAMQEASQTQELAGKNLDYLKGVIDEANQTLKETTETELAGRMATDEYKQSLSDLSTDFENLGVTISDSLMQELALDDFDSTSITKFFDSMKSGVQQSGEELKEIFTQLGLQLPDDLANALSAKEANVQEESVKIMLSIQSGVEVNKDQLKSLFSNLGIELPETLTSNLASKESFVQTETINLLSKLEEGYKLTEGNLKTIFSTLGLELPDDLISSIASKEAETQEEAITLLGKIQEAEEDKRAPLIDEFNKLGIGIADDGLIRAIDGKLGETYDTTSNYIEGGVKKPLEEKESELYNQSYTDGDQVVKGVNKGIEDNQGSTKGVINTWVSKISGWFQKSMGIKSPSKLFAGFGAYTVEGFNEGILENMDLSYALMENWSDGIANSFGYENLKLDMSVPSLDFDSKSYDIGTIQSTMQMEMDARMAEMEYENRQLRAAMEENTQILEKILAQGIVLDDNEFNRRYKSGAIKYRKQTGKQLGISY